MLLAHQLPALQRTFGYSSETTAVLVAGGLICLLGAVDDRFDLDPLTKFVGQIACAGVMVLLGVQLQYVYVPFGDIGTVSLGSDVGVPLTILLTVLAVNAMNMVDGLDGLLAGVAGIAALAFFAYSYYLARTGYGDVASAPTLTTALLAGACLGFLPHNFYPARIFLGDSGSMLIGLMLSAAAVSAAGRADPQTLSSLGGVLPLTLPLLIPLAVLAIPLVDLVLAVLRRTRARRSPFSPDKQHLHHRLLEIGHSQRRAVLTMYLWSGLLAFGTVAIAITRHTIPVLIAMAVLALIAVVLSQLPKFRRGRPAGPMPQRAKALR
jgi:UDP-GlcNAc:undecaprenyl-phosphate GlcNAc-1-phosphate transferase